MKQKNYFSVNLNIMKWSGLWIPDQGEGNLMKFAYLIWGIFFFGFSAFIGIPSELLALTFSYHRIDDFMKNLSVAGTHALALVKVVVWYRNRKEILEIMKELEKNSTNYKGINDFEPEKIIEEEKSSKNLTTRVFFYLAINVSLTAYVGTMLILLTDYKKYEYYYPKGSTNETFYHYEQNLPYFMVIPFNYDSSKLRFGLTLIYNCFPAFSFAWVIIGIDTIFTSLASCLSAHLRIIQGAFRTMRPRCFRALNLPYKEALHDSPEINNVMMMEMNRCVAHLQLIVRMCGQVEAIFTYMTLIQVLSSEILICACLYMVSSIPMTSKTFATELVYLVAIEMQIALYCFYGNKVTLTGQEITRALYEGDWLSTSNPFKKSMLITMIRMRRPLNLTMGKFSPLTLATFVTIGRASYSFFAVIKNSN